MILQHLPKDDDTELWGTPFSNSIQLFASKEMGKKEPQTAEIM